jgi:hypothetical protein
LFGVVGLKFIVTVSTFNCSAKKLGHILSSYIYNTQVCHEHCDIRPIACGEREREREREK